MFVGTQRPYPPSGMTTATWKLVDPVEVDFKALITTQRHLDIDALLYGEEHSHCGDPVPHVIAWGGALFLEDGHHRVVRALMRGQTRGLARIVTPRG